MAYRSEDMRKHCSAVPTHTVWRLPRSNQVSYSSCNKPFPLMCIALWPDNKVQRQSLPRLPTIIKTRSLFSLRHTLRCAGRRSAGCSCTPVTAALRVRHTLLHQSTAASPCVQRAARRRRSDEMSRVLKEPSHLVTRGGPNELDDKRQKKLWYIHIQMLPPW